jgi:hypothetical protein
VTGVDGRERQVVRDLLNELVVRCLPQVETAAAGEVDDVLARLYLLRDAAAAAPGLGPGAAAVAEWINRAAALIRDESDHHQALPLLRQAAARLATAAATPSA